MRGGLGRGPKNEGGQALIDLQQGDCLELMRTIPDKSIDMILCDLPYGTTACKWDTVIPFEPLWAQYKRVIKGNGAIVLFGSQPFTTALISSNMEMFKYEWIWDKHRVTGGQLASGRPLKAHENVVVFYQKQCTYNPVLEEFTDAEIKKMRKHDYVCTAPKIGGGVNTSKGWHDKKKKQPRSLIRINGVAPMSDEKQSFGHPTQKPVALMRYLVETYTNECETVLDNCMGSGSTGVACINTNRNFIGIELDPDYFKIAERRIAEAGRQITLEGVLRGLD